MPGQIEEQIRLDHRPRRLVPEDDLVRAVAVDVLDLDFPVEFLRDLDAALVRRRQDVGEGRLFEVGVVLALLQEALGSDDLGVRECVLPRRHVKVVFDVRRRDVFDRAALGRDCLLDFWREGDGRDDEH